MSGLFFYFYVEASDCDSVLEESFISWLISALPSIFTAIHPHGQWVIGISFTINLALVPKNGWTELWALYICISCISWFWTVVLEHVSVWFVCVGVNTAIAQKLTKERKSSTSVQQQLKKTDSVLPFLSKFYIFYKVFFYHRLRFANGLCIFFLLFQYTCYIEYTDFCLTNGKKAYY